MRVLIFTCFIIKHLKVHNIDYFVEWVGFVMGFKLPML